MGRSADADNRTADTRWRNAIVGYDDVDPATLTSHPENWRTHLQRQADALAGVLGDVGWIAPVIVNRTTGHTIDGHLRIDLARQRGEATVPVAYVELSPEQEAEALLTFDPIAALAEADRANMDALLRQVETDNADVQALLDTLATQAGVIPPTDPLAEWQGMPAFDQPDQMPHRQIIVNLASDEDAEDFARRIGQTVTEKTKSLWYPEQKRRDLSDVAYVGAEDDDES